MLAADIFIDVSRETIQTWTDGRNTKHVGLGATKCHASDPRQNTNIGVYEQTNATPVTQDRAQTFLKLC